MRRAWKGARVVPIPKSSSAKCSPSGYRPISLLSVLSKLLEKHFFSLITEHLDEHHPLSPAQWGFQKGKSIITALLSATHDWLLQLDQNKDICCVFFDFQKAFDTVPHKSLMERLSQLNLHPLILRWIHTQTDKTSTVTLAHARRGLTSTVTLAHARRALHLRGCHLLIILLKSIKSTFKILKIS